MNCIFERRSTGKNLLGRGWVSGWRHGRQDGPYRWHLARLDRHVIRIEHAPLGQQRPDDARVLVGQRHHRLRLARSLFQRQGPAADRIGAGVGGVDHRRRALDPQGARLVVAAPGDAPHAGLVAGEVLAGHQPQPRAELRESTLAGGPQSAGSSCPSSSAACGLTAAPAGRPAAAAFTAEASRSLSQLNSSR